MISGKSAGHPTCNFTKQAASSSPLVVKQRLDRGVRPHTVPCWESFSKPVYELPPYKSRDSLPGWWFLVVFSQPHLKNMFVKMGSSSPGFGVKIKHIWSHQPDKPYKIRIPMDSLHTTFQVPQNAETNFTWKTWKNSRRWNAGMFLGYPTKPQKTFFRWGFLHVRYLKWFFWLYNPWSGFPSSEPSPVYWPIHEWLIFMTN